MWIWILDSHSTGQLSAHLQKIVTVTWLNSEVGGSLLAAWGHYWGITPAGRRPAAGPWAVTPPVSYRRPGAGHGPTCWQLGGPPWHRAVQLEAQAGGCAGFASFQRDPQALQWTGLRTPVQLGGAAWAPA